MNTNPNPRPGIRRVGHAAMPPPEHHQGGPLSTAGEREADDLMLVTRGT